MIKESNYQENKCQRSGDQRIDRRIELLRIFADYDLNYHDGLDDGLELPAENGYGKLVNNVLRFDIKFDGMFDDQGKKVFS